jgi:diguanylate cyclase (GGDEF)-like protein
MVYANAVKREFELSEHVVEDLAALFQSSDQVTREQFRTFSDTKLRHHRGIQALEWVPKVTAATRNDFEQRARQSFPEFEFTDRDEAGNVFTAREQDILFPVYYVEPHLGNEKALGLSPSAVPFREQAIKRAVVSGKSVSSSRIHLIQDHSKQSGLLVFHPVFDSQDLAASYEERLPGLRGLTLGVFRVNDLVQTALDNQQRLPLNILLRDKDVSNAESFLYYHSSDGNHAYQEAPPIDNPSRLYQSEFSLMQRRWQVEVTPQRSAYSVSLLTVAPTVTIGVLATMLLALSFYRWRVNQLAKERNLAHSVLQKENTIKSTEETLLRYNEALSELARNTHLSTTSLTKSLEVITETAARSMDVERVSAWFQSDDRQLIRCVELFELGLGKHSRGTELRSEDYPNYFDALAEEKTIVADDARTDPRTNDFDHSYLRPQGITSMLDIPIRHKGKVVGVVCHEHVGPIRKWTSEEVHFATSVANFVSLAMESIERRQAELNLQQTSERLALINGIASSIKAGMSTQEVIMITLSRLFKKFPEFRASYATISTRGVLKVAVCFTPDAMPSIEGQEADLTIAPDYLNQLQRQQALVVQDVSIDPRFDPLQESMQLGNTAAVLDVPLLHSEGLVGLICLDSHAPHHWKEHEILATREVAEYLELAIREALGHEARQAAEAALEQQKANLENLVNERTAQLEHKANFEMIVASFSTKFINLPIEDFDIGIYDALKSVGEYCGAERCNFVEVLEDERSFIKNHEWLSDGVEPVVPKREVFQVSEFPWILGQAKKKNLIYYPDIKNLPAEANEDRRKLERLQTKSIAIVPVNYGMKLHAVLGLSTANHYKDWSNDDLALFQLFGNMLVNAIERRKYEEALKRSEKLLLKSNKKLKDLATMDALTGVANRRFFDLRIHSEFRRSKREHFPITVIFIDIDHFKHYNDAFGHAEGDEYLKRVAQRIGTFFKRANELFARYGGEEFVATISNLKAEPAQILAEHIRESVEDLAIPSPKGVSLPHLTVSCGVATLQPEINDTPDQLLKAADQALYEAKASGRNCVRAAPD